MAGRGYSKSSSHIWMDRLMSDSRKSKRRKTGENKNKKVHM